MPARTMSKAAALFLRVAAELDKCLMMLACPSEFKRATASLNRASWSLFCFSSGSSARAK